MARHDLETPLAKLGIEAGFRTQTARAEALGFSRNFLMKCESGERLPTKRLKQKMIEVYGVGDQALEDAILLSFCMYGCTRAIQGTLAELVKRDMLIM